MIFKFILILFNIFSVHSINLRKTGCNDFIKTTSGSVIGNTMKVLGKEVEEYLGIPYAEPPVGSLRFAKPKPISKPIEGVIDATFVKNSCIQPLMPQNTFMNSTFNFNEDCLTLNIWNPKRVAKNDLKPVMYWIYGGAFVFGSIFQDWYNGSVLATHDIVLVAVNYRLGWFGFLQGNTDSVPGNIALYDQNLGLKWVRENIHLFGGDKNQITIFGQSAGSFSVTAHILSPLSKGLFKRAIVNGGALFWNKDRPVLTKEEAFDESKKFANEKECFGDDWIDCLRKLDTEEFEAKKTVFFPDFGTEFLPLITQKAFKQGQFYKDIDLLAGFVQDEGSLLSLLFEPSLALTIIGLHYKDFRNNVKTIHKGFHNFEIEKVVKYYLNDTDINNSTAIRWKIYEFIGDIGIKCPTYFFAKSFSRFSLPEKNVFFFELTHTAYPKRFAIDFGVHHGSEFELAFGHPILFPNSTPPEDVEYSKEIMKLYTDFAKYGRPDPKWRKLIDTDALPAVDLIRDLHPKRNSTYRSNLVVSSCNGFWKNYFTD